MSDARTPQSRSRPRWADRLLVLCLPPGVLGESIRGDLIQEYDEDPAKGGVWYAAQAVALSARYLVQRAWDGVSSWARGAPGTAIGEGMMSFWSDVRFGVRMLRKTPLLSGVAVLTMGLGVGLTTYAFNTVYGGVLRDLPIPAPEELHYIGQVTREPSMTPDDFPIHDFLDIREAQTSFRGVEGFHQGTVNIAGEEAPPERYAGGYMTAGALEHVGVPPLMGRTFRTGEDGALARDEIVLGYDVWQNRYGADPEIVGRTIRVNGATTEVVGVMPEGFKFPFAEDVWLPHRIDVDALARGRGRDLTAFARLRPGVSLEAAQDELAAIAGRLEERYPEENEGVGYTAGVYAEIFMPPAIAAIMWIMLGANFGVLLIACVNVANLLLARASMRTKEVAVRTAMGASRLRVIRQLVVESLIIAGLGGILGLALNELGTLAYADVVENIYKPYWLKWETNVPVLVFSLAVTVLAALMAGVLPALRASGVDVGSNLKDESRGSSSLRMGRLTGALVITEIAVSCALLVGAGFMVRSVVNLKTVDLGFEDSGVLVGRVLLFEADYPTLDDRELFYQELKDRMDREPGVQVAALATEAPGLGGPYLRTAVEGTLYERPEDYPSATVLEISSDFFSALRVEPLAGRDFDRIETHGDAQTTAIVSESYALRRLGGVEDALGARLRLGGEGSPNPWMQVVGVVPDLYVGGNTGGIGNDDVSPERVFLPMGSISWDFMTLMVRTQTEPEAFAPALRRVVAELDPNLPVYEVRSLERSIGESTWAFGLFGGMFSVFGIAALFLAAVGLYGVMAFSVTQRRHELGVRLALGAESSSILRLVLGKGVRQLLLGMTLGLVAGGAAAGSLEVMLYGVDVTDPVVYLAIVATLLTAGLLAVLIPARAATRTQPVEAMRNV